MSPDVSEVFILHPDGSATLNMHVVEGLYKVGPEKMTEFVQSLVAWKTRVFIAQHGPPKRPVKKAKK